jgi:hypothetical protein
MGDALFLMVKSSYVSMGRKQRGYVAEPGTAGLSLDSHVPLLGCWKTMFLLQNPLPLVANHMDIYIYIPFFQGSLIFFQEMMINDELFESQNWVVFCGYKKNQPLQLWPEIPVISTELTPFMVHV